MATPTQVLLVYDTAGNLRSCVVPGPSDTDAAILSYRPLPGERTIKASYASFLSLGPVALLASLIGAPTKSTRCVETDSNGIVQKVYHADPAIDTPFTAGNLLLRSQQANVSDTYNGDLWQPALPVFTSPASASWSSGKLGQFNVTVIGKGPITFTATNAPASKGVVAIGLPVGLSFNTSTASFTGTLTAGTYNLVITATNANGSTQQGFTLTVT
jgi:hypothetical protein